MSTTYGPEAATRADAARASMRTAAINADRTATAADREAAAEAEMAAHESFWHAHGVPAYEKGRETMTDQERGRETEQEYGIDNWAPPFSSPETELATTAAMLPAGERQAYLDSLEPVTDETRDRPWYADSKREEADREADLEAGA